MHAQCGLWWVKKVHRNSYYRPLKESRRITWCTKHIAIHWMLQWWIDSKMRIAQMRMLWAAFLSSCSRQRRSEARSCQLLKANFAMRGFGLRDFLFENLLRLNKSWTQDNSCAPCMAMPQSSWTRTTSGAKASRNQRLIKVPNKVQAVSGQRSLDLICDTVSHVTCTYWGQSSKASTRCRASSAKGKNTHQSVLI